MDPDWPFTANAGGKRRRAKTTHHRWDEARNDSLRKLWAANTRVEEIADTLETSRGAIYQRVGILGLPPRNAKPGRQAGQRIGAGKSPRRSKTKASDRSGQRRFSGVENSTGPKIRLPAYDPRSRAGITVFPTTVLPASMRAKIFKSGKESRKLGEIVEKGPWKDMPIFSMTLEERATCPPSCLAWAICYGNNMPFAHRTSDDGTLMRRQWAELASLSAAYPDGFVIRLHVLGDFYSLEYVDFWRRSLVEFPALRVFGFTARLPPDPIGIELAYLARDNWGRFNMRFSGGDLAVGCSEVVTKREDAKFIVCPAESDPDRSCANCALCFNSDVSITFTEH
jgi:hypothetical protein